MSTTKVPWIALVFVVLSFGVAAVLYPSLPETIPTHWNAQGVANAYSPKQWGAFLLPLANAILFLILWAVPAISPAGYRIDRFEGVFRILQAVLAAFLLVITIVTLLIARGVPVPINRVILISLGVLFMILGNFLGKTTKNFFVGIRTPWTLASDEVWLKTHRFGGKLFVAEGILVLIVAAFNLSPLYLLWLSIFTVVACFVYSYLAYRKLEGFRKDPEPNEH